MCVDVADWDATRKAVQDIGPIELLVNNAGIGCLESFLEVKPESFDKYKSFKTVTFALLTWFQNAFL